MAEIRNLHIVSGEDGAGLVAHPDQVLKSGELFNCSCGHLSLRMSSFKVSWPTPHEEAAHASCPDCGDLARWEP